MLNPALVLVNNKPVDFRPQGTILGLKIPSRGFTPHVTERVAKALVALTRLFWFWDLESRIKLHLVKALVIPILTYTPVPTHALSTKSISWLQKVQNAALNFVYNIRRGESRMMRGLHQAASLPPLNVHLHHMAVEVWRQMEVEGWEQFLTLQELH